MSKPDGGPAFPVECDYSTGDPVGKQTSCGTMWETGMTLRDWFATFAPQPSESWMKRMRNRDSLRARDDDRFQMRDDTELRTIHAYEYADAMLAAREDS